MSNTKLYNKIKFRFKVERAGASQLNSFLSETVAAKPSLLTSLAKSITDHVTDEELVQLDQKLSKICKYQVRNGLISDIPEDILHQKIAPFFSLPTAAVFSRVCTYTYIQSYHPSFISHLTFHTLWLNKKTVSELSIVSNSDSLRFFTGDRPLYLYFQGIDEPAPAITPEIINNIKWPDCLMSNVIKLKMRYLHISTGCKQNSLNYCARIQVI